MALVCETSGCEEEALKRLSGVDLGGEAYARVACAPCAKALEDQGAVGVPLTVAERETVELEDVSPGRSLA